MMSYHLTGTISAVLSTLAVAGLATQVHLLLKRWWQGVPSGETASSVISINRFVTSFLLFFALYVYGGLLDTFNHYLVWPRVLAIMFVLTILFQVYRDRRDRVSRMAFFVCLGLFLASMASIPALRPIENMPPMLLPLLVIGVGMIYLQGGVMQICSIRRARTTGGLSREMHLLFVTKDFSLIAFALAMGLASGWPILVISCVGLLVNLSTLWHFRQVRTLVASVTPEPQQPLNKLTTS